MTAVNLQLEGTSFRRTIAESMAMLLAVPTKEGQT